MMLKFGKYIVAFIAFIITTYLFEWMGITFGWWNYDTIEKMCFAFIIMPLTYIIIEVVTLFFESSIGERGTPFFLALLSWSYFVFGLFIDYNLDGFFDHITIPPFADAILYGIRLGVGLVAFLGVMMNDGKKQTADFSARIHNDLR